MSSTSSNNARVHLHVEDSGGDGRVVVLIHGWPLSAAAWSAQAGPLREAGYRVIAYDRRGFGRSEKPEGGFDYDTLSDDLNALLEDKDVRDATLVGFSMGGGEVARFIGRHGQDRLRSVVFASAVPPYLMKTKDNPDGPLTPAMAKEMEEGLKAGRETFFDGFTRDFFSVDGELKVSEAQRQQAIALCLQSDQKAALGCMEAFATTDFRPDLAKTSVLTLILHGDSDGIVPFEGSGKRTLAAIAGSEVAILKGAPHGCNVSHAEAFNRELIAFLTR